MIKDDINKTTIDLSEIFHTTFDLDEQIQEKYSSAIFFLANKEGQTITIREVGSLALEAKEIVCHMAEKLITGKLPFYQDNYLIDAIPISLEANHETWNGCIGAIMSCDEEKPEIIRTLLVGFKQSLLITSNFLPYKNKYDNYKQTVSTDQFIVTVLKKSNYSNDFGVFAQAFIDKLKELLVVGDVTLLLLDRTEDLLIPSYSTESTLIINKEDYLVKVDDIAKTLSMFEKDQTCLITKRMAIENGFDHFDGCFEDYLLVPLVNNEIIYTLFVYGVQKEKVSAQVIQSILDLINGVEALYYKNWKYESIKKDQKRKELLLQVTKKFHSSMDVSAILGEIIDALNQVFPSFEVALLLSHEWEVSEDLPVHQLSYGKDLLHEMATNAYLTGKIQIEDNFKERKSSIFAPLRGKQGVYGVLKITSNSSFVFPTHEIDFIEVLADTGGNAIENAELYQQSRQLVEDLQLINKTSHQLNLNLRLSETINYMTKQIKTSFSAQEIGFFMFRNNGDVEVIEGSTNYFFQRTSFDEILAFCERIKREKDSLFIGDLASQEPYLLKPYRSFIAVPMVQNGELKGAVIIVHEHAYHFSFNQFKLLQSLIHHSTLAFTNSMLHEELEKLVITDHLTRLYARNYLDEKIQESMEKDAYGCLILFDIDNFKQINDHHGHQIGDDIIIQVANILKKNIKDSDIAARWGGEELAVYLSKVDSEIGALVAERIRQKVEEDTCPNVTISCGISDWKQVDSNKSLKTLFKRSDQALYTAKRNGKNVIVVFDETTCS